MRGRPVHSNCSCFLTATTISEEGARRFDLVSQTAEANAY